MKETNKTDKKMMLLLFILCFVTHFLINPVFKTISSLPTEMASVSVNAFLAGKDWSIIMADTDYYGTGFYILLTPVMMLTDNAYVIHQITLFVVVLLECIPSVLCYKIMRKYLGVSDERFCCLVALALSFFDVVNTSVAINEHPLKVILWLIIYLVFLIGDAQSKRKRVLYTLLISILLAYSYTMHTRAVTFLIVLAFAIVVYYLVYRKWLVDIPTIIVGTLPLLYISRKYVKYITKLIWQTANGTTLNNSDGIFIKMFKLLGRLFSGVGLKAFFNIVLGQIFAANIYTLGFVLIIFLVTFLVVKKAFLTLFKKKVDGKPEIDRNIMFITALCMSAVIITISGLGVVSIEGAIGVIIIGKGAKSYFYLRYFFFYLSPMFMVTMAYVYHFKDEVLKFKEVIMVAFTGIIIYVFAYIVPTTLTGPTNKLDRFHYLSSLCFRKSDELLSPADFIKVAGIVLVLYICYYCILKKGRMALLLIIVTTLMSYQYNYQNLVANVSYSDSMYTKIDAFKEQIYGNDEYREKYDVLNIFSDFTAQMAQYEMTNKSVRDSRTSSIGVNDLVLTNFPMDPAQMCRLNLIYEYRLDENEYIYSRYKIYDFMHRTYTRPTLFLRPAKLFDFGQKSFRPELKFRKKIVEV
ncbi:MAG: hypothetical protein K2I03_09980 [Lachnospiraceae bacterium]|nr:hypothetical protein [Lachnospiraceae bacterium]